MQLRVCHVINAKKWPGLAQVYKTSYPIFPAVARLVRTSSFKILTCDGSELRMKKFRRCGSNIPLRDPGPWWLVIDAMQFNTIAWTRK